MRKLCSELLPSSGVKRRINLPWIRKRAKAVGLALPDAFASFVRTATAADMDHGWFHVTSLEPRDLGIHKAAAGRLVPFLRLGDGGAVAFWRTRDHGTPIVHLDSEGGRFLIAAGFDDFLGRLAGRRTGVHDLDDAKLALVVGSPSRSPGSSLAALRRAFASFVKDPD